MRLGESSSAGKIGTLPGAGTPWSDVLPYVSEWTWYIGEVEPGTSTVRFTGAVADPECKIGIWEWLEEDVSAGATGINVACAEPEMPQYRATRDLPAKAHVRELAKSDWPPDC